MSRLALPAARLGLLALGLAVLLSGPPRVSASTVVVPDQAPTIQAGLDAKPDTVLVRPGIYAESPQVIYDVALLRTPDTSSDWVVVDTLWTHNENAGPFLFQGLRVKGPVMIVGGGWSEYLFTQCDLQGSVNDNIKNYAIWFSKCRIVGTLDLWVDGMELDSCHVMGSVGTSKDSPVTVRGCLIEGGGVFHYGDNNFLVAGNTIRGGGFGVYSRAEATISGNVIEDCTGAAITMNEHDATITNNVIRRCGAGISADWGNYASIVGNTVERSASYGLAVGSIYKVDVRDNILWMCAGDGMSADQREGGPLTVRNNTSAMNGGSGYVSSLYDYETQEWSGNIGFGNGQYGFRWLRPGAATFTCNDWNGNTLGELQGRPFSSTEFSTDPEFCDPPGGDLHLNSASPLLDWPGCGQIGALGVGCGATPTLVQRFTAGRVNGGVRVVWQVAAGATASEVWVERAEGADGQAWTRPVMDRSTDGGSMVELDRSALPDHAYRYRLVAMDGGKLVVLDPGILVEGQARLSFALVQVGPSPGGGPLRITFTLAHAATIRIDVFDLLGRRVATPAQGTWPAGAQAVAWDGFAQAGMNAPAGMYVIRYAYPGGQDRRSIMRLR